jgi:hypothetical protein
VSTVCAKKKTANPISGVVAQPRKKLPRAMLVKVISEKIAKIKQNP